MLSSDRLDIFEIIKGQELKKVDGRFMATDFESALAVATLTHPDMIEGGVERFADDITEYETNNIKELIEYSKGYASEKAAQEEYESRDYGRAYTSQDNLMALRASYALRGKVGSFREYVDRLLMTQSKYKDIQARSKRHRSFNLYLEAHIDDESPITSDES